jgi:hypothetical protein
MVSLYKTLLVVFVFLFAINIIVFQVSAQDNAIESEILPSEGTASTDILIRFITRSAGIGNVDKADIFWDDFSILLNEQGVQGADGSYNYHLNIPTEPPLSDVGNHTIRVDSYVLNYGQVSFNFTFNVTEYIPSPEYVALNATYYSLLANHTDLLGNYSLLFTNYTTLLNEHNTLSLNYNSLLANFNSLVANYNSLSANYNSLLANSNNLQTSYASLVADYNSLQKNFESLSSNYTTLRADYDSLNSDYHSLRSDYDGLLGESAASRILNYVLIASTIALAVFSVYLWMRKPVVEGKKRY